MTLNHKKEVLTIESESKLKHKRNDYNYSEIVEIQVDPGNKLGAKDKIFPKWSYEFIICLQNGEVKISGKSIQRVTTKIHFMVSSGDELDLWVHSF